MAETHPPGSDMGNFYGNISVRASNHAEVVEFFRQQDRTALISDVTDGWVVVYDNEFDDGEPGVIGPVAQSLSESLGCTVFAVSNYDDDILWFLICDSGRVVDEYDSAPGYFEGDASPPKGGNPKVVSQSLGRPSAELRVREILHSGEYVLQTERHADLVEALGLSGIAVGSGYRYITRGEYPAGLQETNLTRIG